MLIYYINISIPYLRFSVLVQHHNKHRQRILQRVKWVENQVIAFTNILNSNNTKCNLKTLTNQFELFINQMSHIN